MNEETFKDFATALDILQQVMYGTSDDGIFEIIKESYKKLDAAYHDIKTANNYKDSTDD